MFFFELARPRSDDFIVQLNDRERQGLYDTGLYELSRPLQTQAPHLSVLTVARHSAFGGLRLDRNPDHSVKLRTESCCDHLHLCGFSNVLAQDVASEVLRFEAALSEKLIDFVSNRHHRTDEDLAMVAAWAHCEIVRIRPLPQGNLVLAELFVAILFTSLGMHTAVQPSPTGTTGSKISHARLLRAEVLRATYDDLIRKAAMSGTSASQQRLGGFFLGRLSTRAAA